MARKIRKTDAEIFAPTAVLTDPVEVKRWLKMHDVMRSNNASSKNALWAKGVVEVTQAGVINTSNRVFIKPPCAVRIDGKNRIPVQFGVVVESFDAPGCNLDTMLGFPRKALMHIDAEHNNIKTLEGCPEVIHSYMSIQHNPIDNLSGIYRYIREFGRASFWMPEKVKSHVLGLLLVNTIKEIQPPIGSTNAALIKVCDILNGYLKGIDGRDRGDTLACQEELIDAGFEDYAQL